ncbi:MAG: sulfotransferase [Puniceicoccaceae bacterium]
MTRAFWLSIRLHLTWLAEALGKRGRQLAPLTLRRILILLIFVPAGLLLQLVHWIGFLLDELFFRDYHEVEIKEPLIITGIPRSGTTFIHRTLSRDSGQFTTFRTWEAILAPSITERKVLQAISLCDEQVGRPLHRFLDYLTEKLTGGFADIHEVGLKAPEEDYLTLLPVGGCFIMVLAFPASRSIWQLGRFHEIPDEHRATLVSFYQACLKKHLYCAGPGKRLLSKNAAFGSWLTELRQTFPDARYIFCIRAPSKALSSQLSSLRSGLEFFGTMPAADVVSLELQTVFAHVYRILLDETHSFLIDRLAIIDQSQLKEETSALLESSLRQLCIPISDELKTILIEAGEESQKHKSGHQHVPLVAKTGPTEFNSLVNDIYEEILRHPYLKNNDR